MSAPTSSEVATTQPAPAKVAVSMGDAGVELHSLDEAWRFATAVVQSGLVPRSLDTPAKVVVALQTGLEAGLKPMQALRSVYVVNGLPAWTGDGALALVRASGLCESYSEGVEGEGDEMYGWARTKRAGQEIQEERFTVAQAKRARLWGKSGPWSEYAERMLRYRARGFLLRDVYGDVLRGLAIAEEVADYPARTTRDVNAAPPPPTGADPILAQLAGTAEAVDAELVERKPYDGGATRCPECGKEANDFEGPVEDQLQHSCESGHRWDPATVGSAQGSLL